MTNNADSAKSIFMSAIEKYAPEQWTAFLDGACRGDPRLRGNVEQLLHAHAAMGSIRMSAPARTLDDPPREKPGTVIGPYKLLQQLGEGGMGVVYMAEQTEPVERRVALKVIKPGMDTGQVIARFEAERQALAMMDHPGIARVFAAGATESGRPYFAMELVKGIPITQYCDEQHFNPKQRLALFLQVCQAVQHAHQKGIIHRDLKPTNVLVAEYDQQPVPKVIDFGVAKATNQRLTQKTMFTEFGQLIGTLEYMSPEQAKLNQLDIDTRSDVYSLGVLLYELLTGQTPFDRARLHSAAFEEMLRIIREEEPPKPSTRLSGSNDRLVIAKHRNQTPDRLDKQVRGDLDWIAMKALEKDRGRRYETASSFAADIERFLNDEAIMARPPSRIYRAQKFVRRNRGAVISSFALLLVLCLGLAGTSVGMLRARREQFRAGAAEISAVAAERRATQDRDDAVAARNAEAKARKEAQKRREEADEQRNLAEEREQKVDEQRKTIQQNLYYAEMNLAGKSALQTSGIGRVSDLLSHWQSEDIGRDLRGWEWYYLDSLCHRELFTLSGHIESVNSVCWSPDGKLLASASGTFTFATTQTEHQTVKIWDVATRKLIRTLRGHSSSVRSVCWSPDGKRVASGSEDLTVKIWDVETGEAIRTLGKHTQEVNSVAWSPDGHWLASARGGGQGWSKGGIRIWDAETGDLEFTLGGYEAPINSICWSPNGRLLASATGHPMPGTPDQTVKIWHVAAKKLIHTLKKNEGRVMAVAWSPDGERLASAGYDQTINVWDLASEQVVQELQGVGEAAKSLSWSPDGKWLATVGDDRTLRLWDVPAGKESLRLRGHSDAVQSLDWNFDGTRVATASMDGTVKVWDPAVGPETLQFGGRTARTVDASWDPTGTRIASAGWDNTIRLWDAASGQETLVLRGHTDAVAVVRWNKQGNRLASSSLDGFVKIWDAATGNELFELPRQNSAPCWDLSWSPNGKFLAAAGGDFGVHVWDVAKQESSLSIHQHNYHVVSVCWSPDGTRLASGSNDKTVRIWDATNGRAILAPLRHDRLLPKVRWSPDGTRLATADASGDIMLWDAATGKELLTLSGNTTRVTFLAWSPDGERLASASHSGRITIWDPLTGEEALALRGHDDQAWSVCWSPDGERLVSSGGNLKPTSEHETIMIWDATLGYELDRKRRAERAKSK